MFGLISKKKLIKEAVEIYLRYDTCDATDDTEEKKIRDFYYRGGNANALNGLCSRLGIDLTEIIKQIKYETWLKEHKS